MKTPAVYKHLHNSQLPENWVVSSTKSAHTVSFPAGLCQVVPVFYPVTAFEQFWETDDPEQAVWFNESTQEIEYIKPIKFFPDGHTVVLGKVVYKNKGPIITIKSPDAATTIQAASILIEEKLVKIKKDILKKTDKYFSAIKKGKKINWMHFSKKGLLYVVVLPIAQPHIDIFLESHPTSYDLEPLKYELEGLTAVRAATQELAESQALEILNWAP